jgi:large subunit ribosomal protein L19
METLDKINKAQLKKVPALRPGDTVQVHAKIIEGSKERIQIFEGVVLRVKGTGISSTFTVRKISYGVGVERTFLLHSPKIAKIQIVKRAKVRRAYLTYLRNLRGKSAKLRDKQFDSLAVNVKQEDLKPEELAPPMIDEDAEITELTNEAVDIKEADTLIEGVLDQGINEPTPALEEDETELPEVEVEEGLEKAEEDLEKGVSEEGENAEENTEEEPAE